MKSNRVGPNLGVAFCLLIAVLIGVGIVGLGQMSQMNDETHNVTDVRWAKVKLAREALHYSDLNSRLTMEVFLLDGQQQSAALLEGRARNTNKISEILNKIEAQVSSKDEKALLAKVEATRKPYIDSYLKALDLLINQGKFQEARQVMVGVTLPYLVGYHDAWEEFVAYQGRQMDLAEDAVETHYWSARSQVIGLIGLFVLVAGGIAAIVTHQMTREISNRRRAEQDLRDAQAGLEDRVRERTAQLQELHQQLVESSRLAGMAEVATGVLHNVGNVLNSVTVSANVIAEKIHQSPVANLCRATEMIDGHREDLASFLTADRKGQQLPGYFSIVAKVLRDENEAISGELSSLAAGIEHIRQIVHMQLDYTKTSTVRSPVNAAALIDDALRISMSSLDRHGVAVVREVQDVGVAEIDKHKTLQILINLIGNAKNAVKGGGANKTPTLTVRLAKVPRSGAELLRYEVIDNGMGIPPENLARVFNHGFTTRAGGHGFGLHSAANAAQEMGGSLMVSSDGVGKGAGFTLDIPYIPTGVKAASAA